MTRLAQEQRGSVVTYSSGKLGEVMALAARKLDAPAVVVMTRLRRRSRSEAQGRGAEVIVSDTISVERRSVPGKKLPHAGSRWCC